MTTAPVWFRTLRVPVPAVAWSADGSAFAFEAPVDAHIALGGFVRLSTPTGTVLLGQVLSREVTVRSGPEVRIGQQEISEALGADASFAEATLHPRVRLVAGAGRLLGAIRDGILIGGGDDEAFDHADVAPADDALLALLPSPAKPGEATVEIGSLRQAPGVPARLRAAGFNRHTFLCGQSGSGKTYALGVLLEGLVARTGLRLLVLDPNGDHVHLGATRPDVAPEVAAAYGRGAAGGRPGRAAPADDEEPLRAKLGELGSEGRAALLRLDPLRDRDEYAALLRFAAETPTAGWESVQEAQASLAGPGGDASLASRATALRLLEMEVWPQGRPTAVDVWAGERPRALVADVSGFGERRERVTVAYALLRHLWERRRDREPVLVVVDEAHDLCPRLPDDELSALLVDLFVRIAGEGRKYGLHLLLATQRPDKLHPNVLTQCDNLVLLRVNAAADRATLRDVFSFAPADLVTGAGSFGLGEALVAGPLSPVPLLARFGGRITPEGGGDVPTDWAALRSS